LHGLLGRFRTQHLARSLVQQLLHLLEFVSGHGVEVGILGEEVADEPVGVLVCASLPGGVWVGEEHDHVGFGREEPMLGHLQPVVVGHGKPDVQG